MVITRFKMYIPSGGDQVMVAHNFDDALSFADHTIDRIFVIGGGEVYTEAFQHLKFSKLYLTKILKDFDCDTIVNVPANLTCVREEQVQEDGVNIMFTEYI